MLLGTSKEIGDSVSITNCYYLENTKDGNAEAGSGVTKVTDKANFVTILNDYVTENNETEGNEKLKEWVITNNELCFKN